MFPGSVSGVDWSGWLLLAEWCIRVGMLFVVPSRHSSDAAKAWLLLIFFEPLAGTTLYLLMGRAKLPAWRTRREHEFRQRVAPIVRRLRAHPNVFRPDLSDEHRRHGHLAERLGEMPILGGNAVEVLCHYNGMIDRLVADIDAAQRSVHLLFYIVADDAVGGRVVEAMGRAAARGVRCRLLYDPVGSRPFLGSLAKRAVRLGVDVAEMLPIRPFQGRLMARLDLRNHRKIAVIDGGTGYAGSLNLIEPGFKKGLVYEELMVRVTGPAVLELQFVFLSDWFVETGSFVVGDDVLPDPVQTGAMAVQMLPSGPDFPVQNNQRLFVSMVHEADRSVHLITPYFIPDQPLLQAMQTAAQRGVDVRLILPRSPDSFLVSRAQRAYYGPLLEAGVHIHLYRPAFLHSKYLCIDDGIAVVGSSNLDMRSFLLNSEITLICYDHAVAEALRLEAERTIAASDSVDPAAWARRPFYLRVVENLMRLLSPVL